MARQGRRRATAAAALVLLVGGLAGCSGDDNPTPSAQSTSATSLTNQELPPGFPKSDVPVLQGTVIAASQPTDPSSNRWRLLLQTPEPPDKAVDDAAGLLTDAGWTAGKTPGPDSRTLTRDSGERVVLSAQATGGSTQLLYLITLG